MTIDSAFRLSPVAHLEQTIQFNDDEQVKKIRDVKNRGLLAPYEAALSKKENHWDRETWLDRIHQIANRGASDKSSRENYLLPFFLFAAAIDPDVSVEEKQAIIATIQQSLNKKELESLHFNLIKKLPPTISTNILRYYTIDTWKVFNTYIQQYYSINHYWVDIGEIFTPWIDVAISSNWPNEEKKIFLDAIFDVISTADGDEVLYYFRLHSSRDLLKQLRKICSPKLDERIENLKNEVVKFGNAIFSKLNVTCEIHLHNNKRKYFLEWFYRHLLYLEEASLIAVSFNEEDWKWLQKRANKENTIKNRTQLHLLSGKRSPSPLISLAMKWMIDIANRLKQKQPRYRSYFSNSSSFFKYASSVIGKEHGWFDIPKKSYREFSKALTPENLFKYFEAFNSSLKREVIESLLQKDPQKLISWLERILRITEDNFDQKDGVPEKRSVDAISELISLIGNSNFQKAISIIFDMKQHNHVLMLSTFCASSKEHRKEILKHILLNRVAGIQTLTQWVKMCLLEGNLKPYVKDVFLLDTYLLLQKIDPTIANELKTILDQDTFVQSSPKNQEFVDLTFPVGIDLNNPTARQELAIRKLKHHFLTPGVPYQDREKFVSGLEVDLKVKDDPDLLIETFHQRTKSTKDPSILLKLFDQLPKETWPLIFLHFDVCPRTRNRDQEQDSKEKLKTKEKLPTTPEWIPDLPRWIDLAVQTLAQMNDNPCFTYNGHHLNVPADQSIERLFKAIRKTKTTHAVIQKFIETVPPALFIPTMNQVLSSDIYNLQDIISQALDNAEVNKTTFIAECIISQNQRNMKDKQSGQTWNISSLEDELWQKPYLKSHEERSAVSKVLIDRMGMQFLRFFYDSTKTATSIIKSLNITDQAYTKQIFHSWINLLTTKATDRVDIKLEIFQNICHAYTHVGLDVLELLKSEFFKDSLPIIQEWYCSESLIDNHLHLTKARGLTLLRFFNEQGFYSVIFRQIKAIFTSPGTSFNTLNWFFEALENLKCKDKVIEQLFDEHQEILELMKASFQKYMLDWFDSEDFSHSFPLFCRLMPDWKEHLIASTKDQMQQIKKEPPSYIPRYLNMSYFFKSLAKLNVLEDFIASLKADASEEFVRDLNEAYEFYTIKHCPAKHLIRV